MRSKTLSVVAIGVITASLAVGCSSKKDKTTASTSSSAAAATSSSSSAAAPADTSSSAAPAATSSSAAPADSSSSAAPAAAGGPIGLDIPRADTDFWNSYISYVPKFAKELGIDLKTTSSANDVQKLIANVKTLQGQGVKAIVMAPQDTAAIAPTLKALEEAKIPVVTIDTRPDQGNVFMVVRANNLSYGEKACAFLGEKMKGAGSVVELMGGQVSINGRDRRQGFGDCMKAKYPNIKILEEPTEWDGAKAASMLQTALTSDKNIRGVYMHASFALAQTVQVLKSAGLTAPAGDPKHVYVVSNDGIPEELKLIKAGTIDATVSQPADLFAKYGEFYAQAAAAGKTFAPGKTDHDSEIIQVRPGLLEDELAAPLVTKDNVDDKTLWGNNVS